MVVRYVSEVSSASFFGYKQSSVFLDCLILKMEALQSSETSGTIHPTTQRVTSQKICIFSKVAVRTSNKEVTYLASANYIFDALKRAV
jgi:hypothetical protein